MYTDQVVRQVESALADAVEHGRVVFQLFVMLFNTGARSLVL